MARDRGARTATAGALNEEALARVAALAVRNEPRAALRLATEIESGCELPDRAAAGVLSAMRSLACFIGADYSSAVAHAESALHLTDRAASEGEPRARLIACAARMVASAGHISADPSTEQRIAEELWTLRFHADGSDTGLERVATALLLEACFATGRLRWAAQVLDERFPGWDREPLDTGGGPADLPSIPLFPVRMLFYGGREAEAAALLERVLEQPVMRGEAVWLALCDSLLGLCAGIAGDRGRARRAEARVAARFPKPKGYLEASARAIAGHGVAACGDLERGAEAMLEAGGPGLRRLQIVDRALALELLARAALTRGDSAEARRCGRRMLRLSAHPAAQEIALRLFSELDLSDGHAQAAMTKAEAAVARAEVTGALREAAEADLLRARALVSLGRTSDAAEVLQRAAHSATARGDTGKRREAARWLRRIGRRVAPPRGGGWDALSERERQVAVLAAQGFDDGAIGHALFLSVRSVSRILHRSMVALDVARRSALPARLAPFLAEGSGATLPRLTRRQEDVAALVAEGRSNAEIAAQLGISPRTVERHLAAAFTVWGVSSRSALAHRFVTERDATPRA